MDPDLFNLWAWDLGVFRRLWLGELKKYVIVSFWQPVAMETIQDGRRDNYLKSLKLQSYCMQIHFLFTVSTNIMLSSLLPRILGLLCFSFILLYYLHFMLVKMIPIIFQMGIQLKQISPSTNQLVKVKINTYTNTVQAFKTLPLLKAEP